MAESEEGLQSDADRKKRKNKGRYCVAGYPNQVSCKNTSYTPGITMLKFPENPETRAEWTKFVHKHRPDFHAPPEKKHLSLCSAHFKDDCFSGPRLSLDGMKDMKFRRILIPGSVPSEDNLNPQEQSDRDKRHHRRTVMIDNFGSVPTPAKRRKTTAETIGELVVGQSSSSVVGGSVEKASGFVVGNVVGQAVGSGVRSGVVGQATGPFVRVGVVRQAVGLGASGGVVGQAVGPEVRGGVVGQAVGPGAGGGVVWQAVGPEVRSGVVGQAVGSVVSGVVGQAVEQVVGPGAGGGVVGQAAGYVASGGVVGQAAGYVARGGVVGQAVGPEVRDGGVGQVVRPEVRDGGVGQVVGPEVRDGVVGQAVGPEVRDGGVGQAVGPEVRDGGVGQVVGPGAGGGVVGHAVGPEVRDGVVGQAVGPVMGSDVVGQASGSAVEGDERKTINYRMRSKNLGRSNRRLRSTVAIMKAEMKKIKKQLSDLADPETSQSEDEEFEEEVEEPVDEPVEEENTVVEDDADYFVWSTEESAESEDESPKEEWIGSASAESSEETEGDETTSDTETQENNIKVQPGTPDYKEPKFIVFYGMLLSLFSLFCFNCKASSPKVTMKTNGTMVTVNQECTQCISGFKWRSQPYIFGRYPAGNVMLSFGTLMAGASISKVLLVFRHMGLCVFSSRTYFRHQRMFLLPSILKFWETYRDKLLEVIRKTKDIVWCGDGRFDSMGHCAKYGAYTMMSTTIMKIVHFEIVQANETGGSPQTELEGAKRSFKFLEQAGVQIQVFISDRHRGIAKWIRESCMNTTHFYDVWHVARSLWKKLLKASKEGGCAAISSWMKGIRRHLYWCATSTASGFGSLIVAKWRSFIRHVADIHSEHPSDIYTNCNHGALDKRLWIKRGTAAHDKLKKILHDTMFVKDVEKLSQDAQTSSLEGFHATLNHWHPKMIGFSWLGSCCRHILASLHFNENVKRATRQKADGSKYYRVTYPKFKLGEESVKEVPVPPTYEYVEDVCNVLFTMPLQEMKAVHEKYTANVPEPLNRQFPDRMPKAEAVKLYEARKKYSDTPLYPPVSEQEELLERVTSAAERAAAQKASKGKRVSHCSKCKKPGHNKTTCPDRSSSSTAGNVEIV